MKLSSFCSVVLISGIGYGLLTIRLVPEITDTIRILITIFPIGEAKIKKYSDPCSNSRSVYCPRRVYQFENLMILRYSHHMLLTISIITLTLTLTFCQGKAYVTFHLSIFSFSYCFLLYCKNVLLNRECEFTQMRCGKQDKFPWMKTQCRLEMAVSSARKLVIRRKIAEWKKNPNQKI